MQTKLENEILEVVIGHKGAELCSLKNKYSNIEYIWHGDSRFWGRHAPILFPIVGKVVNNEYRIESDKHTLNQHGFARDFKFELINSSDINAVFELSFNELTLKLYPYKFKLYIEYTLNDRELNIKYKVVNTDDKNIFFSIGAHPGFNCPLFNDEKMEEYYFEFEKNETLSTYMLNKDGFLTGELKPFLDNSNTINIKKELFENDALIFKGLKSNFIRLKNISNTCSIKMDFEGFPYLGLWSKPTGAPFVCIEPWFGHADYENFKGNFSEKEGILELGLNNDFSCSYSITIE